MAAQSNRAVDRTEAGQEAPVGAGEAERAVERGDGEPLEDRDPLARRQLLLHRRVVAITPERIEVRPPRSTFVLPIIGIALTSLLLAALILWTDSLPFWLLPLILLIAVVVLPLSGMTLVYAAVGAAVVADKAGRNVSVKQRFLGLGVGTTEMVPFWKIREFLVEEVGRARLHPDGDEPAHEIAQWDLVLVKKSGKRIRVGGYAVARNREEEGLDAVMEVAEAFTALSGAPLRGPIW